MVHSWQVTDAAIQVNGSSVVITPPQPFRQNGSYYVQIASGAFEDLAGFDFSGYLGTTAWNFRTGDTQPPQWLRLQPPIGNAQVSLDTTLELQFNEPIKRGSTGEIRLRRVSEPTQLDTFAISSSAIEVSGSTVIIRPPQRLAGGAVYQVEIDTGALTDSAGNPFAGFTGNTWNFRTALLQHSSIRQTMPWESV